MQLQCTERGEALPQEHQERPLQILGKHMDQIKEILR